MSKKLTIHEIQEKSNFIHGDKYDFSKFVYINNKTKGIIICKTHGEFKQNANNHISLKQGCPKCKAENNSIRLTKPYSEFSKKLYDKFKGVLSVSEKDFKGTTIKTIATCEKHGDFLIEPYRLLSGTYGCSKCARELQNTKLKSTHDFIKNSIEIHGNNYNYEKVKYIGNKTSVIINCPTHGDFEQVPMNHLTGSGCQKCANSNNSKLENELFEFVSSYVYCEKSNRKLLKGKEIDIYIPELKLAIEFNGLYWHSDIFKNKKSHLNKTINCEELGVRLIHVFEDEWVNKKEIVKSRILNLIGKTPNKIYARKCKIKELTTKECRSFFEQNHIQGNVNSKIRYGLFYENELVSAMTFGGLRKNLGQNSKIGYFELLRFCNKLNVTVVGGASKLIKWFLKNNNVKELISYADRRWSNGNLYIQLGFDFINNSYPNYFYVKKGYLIRHNRFNFRKSVLIEQGYDKNKTEKEIMKEIGYDTISDCGSKKYKLTINKF